MARDPGSDQPVAVYLETGQKRVFACALDWPGWCRSGKSDREALEALAAYAERYAPVALAAGVPFPGGRGDAFQVVEQRTGSASYTDFGVPGVIAASDWEPLTSEEAARLAGLVSAAWIVLDRIAATAPAELRKGPRGGGRDRDKVVDHVLGAEVAYARKLGIKRPQPARDDAPAIAALRADILAALRMPAEGASTGWPPRYAARRIAWHVLDHAWEIEDRSAPAR